MLRAGVDPAAESQVPLEFKLQKKQFLYDMPESATPESKHLETTQKLDRIGHATSHL